MSVARFEAFTPEALNASGNVACLLDGGYRIQFCNQAWDRFAIANGGHRCLATALLGSSLFAAIPPVLTTYYLRAFDATAASRQPFEVDYECSSPELHRVFRLQIFPLARGFGMVHSLRVERPHNEPAVAPTAAHVGEGGFLVMCAHCRRTRRAAEPAVWDWVPEHLRQRTLAVSHGICPPCRQHFYDG